MTREQMEVQFTQAMRLLWELTYDEEAFNHAVDSDNGGKYELGESFDEFLCQLGSKVRFTPKGTKSIPRPMYRYCAACDGRGLILREVK